MLFFLAWRNEHKEALRLGKELVQTTQPNIGGRIVHIMGFTDQRLGNLVVLYVLLKNTGADSIADRFSVVHNFSGKSAKGKLIRLDSDVPLTSGGLLKAADDLYAKTTEEPIKRGAQKVGILVCRFSRTMEELLHEDSQYEISFFDINDIRAN